MQGKKGKPPAGAEWYSERNLEKYLTDKPEAVTKLLAYIFRPNRLSEAERESIAADLDIQPPRSGIPEPGRPANGGSPKTKGANG